MLFVPSQPDLDPVMIGRSVVPQQRRRLVLIHDHDVEIAIVIEVAEGAAATQWAPQARAGLRIIQLLESPIAQIAKDDARTSCGILRQHLLDVPDRPARDEKDVGPAVVVEVDEARCPS